MRKVLVRSLVGSLVALALIGGARAAVAAVRSIQVNGKLTSGGAAGSFVDANCAVVRGGIEGRGSLYGVNPADGNRYNYPFVITSGTTGPNALYLYGKFQTGEPVRIAATVPRGRLTFTYVLRNGTRVESAGTGTVTVR